VRVLDSAGREVRHLFTGFVEPGQRSFSWDGNLSAGESAPSGDYKIDVQTGDSHQTKAIHIKPE
jgi:flagellar hook assembly protein FlgD